MVDATLATPLPTLQPNTKSSLAHLNRPCKSLAPLSAVACHDDCVSKLNLKAGHGQFGSLNSEPCPRFVNWVASLQHRPGPERGRTSSQVAVAGLRDGRGESGGNLPPSSREETLQQAGASLLSLLEKTLTQRQGPTTVKERKKARGQIRLRVDIPQLEDSPESLFNLATNLVDCFLGQKQKIAGTVAVYNLPESALLPNAAAISAPPATTAASPPLATGTGPKARYLNLERRERLPPDAVVALVIAPRFLQTASLESVARDAGVRPMVVVNPEWSEEEERDKSWGAFLTSFSVAYSFIPLNIQGIFSKTEGAVLKQVKSGAPEGWPWLIFVKEGGDYKCVSSLKKRPTPADLENALYSVVAANSPVTKSIKFLRGLVSK